MSSDHYNTLGVSRKASGEDIVKAYRALALKFHPDRNPAPEAATRMIAINKAYEVLGDPKLRRAYDRQLAQAGRPSAVPGIVLQAARDVVMRSGWRVVEDGGRTMLLEKDRVRLRLVFVESLDIMAMSRITHGVDGTTVVLAATVEGSISAQAADASNLVWAVDLMQGRCYGSALPEGDARRSLLTPFL
jgi:hypothetical protein